MSAIFFTIFTKLLIVKVITGQCQYSAQQSPYYYPPSYAPPYDYTSSSYYPTAYSLPAASSYAVPTLPTSYPALPPTYPAVPATYPTLPPTYPTLPNSYPTLPPTYPRPPPSCPTVPPTYPTPSPTCPTLPPTYPTVPPVPLPTPCPSKSSSPPPTQQATAYFMSKPVEQPKVTLLSEYQKTQPQNYAPCPCSQGKPENCQNEDIPPSYYCPCCPGCKKLPPPANFNLPPPPMPSDVLPGLISQIPPLLPRCEPSTQPPSYQSPCRQQYRGLESPYSNEIGYIDGFLSSYGF